LFNNTNIHQSPKTDMYKATGILVSFCFFATAMQTHAS